MTAMLSLPVVEAGPVAKAGSAAPLVALLVRDPLRRRALLGVLAVAPLEDADVLLVELRPGEPMPPDAAGFEGPLLLLTDDAALAADRALAGVVPRDATPAQIAAAAAAVAAGLAVRLPGAAERPGFALPDPPGRPLLTPREVEVLAAVGQGMSNKAIARRLGISAHTVKYYLEAIFQKLDVRSRAEAVTRGLRLGVQVL